MHYLKLFKGHNYLYDKTFYFYFIIKHNKKMLSGEIKQFAINIGKREKSLFHIFLKLNIFQRKKFLFYKRPNYNYKLRLGEIKF